MSDVGNVNQVFMYILREIAMSCVNVYKQEKKKKKIGGKRY